MAQRYTCEIVIHRATNVPLGDLNNLSCDPYIVATLAPLHNASGKPGPDASQPSISFRTLTARKTLNPDFDARWIVSGIPSSGFLLVLQLFDEDPGNRDDRLGKAVITFPNDSDPSGTKLQQGWHSGEREYKIHKRHAFTRPVAAIGTYVAKVFTHGRVGHRVRVFLSVRVLGAAPKLDGEDAERVYTLGPHIFVRHLSPLATHLTAVKAFKANRLQLAGPVPAALRHRYVGFAPFIKAMFRARGIEGLILNHALHRQHHAIYKWDKNTVFGVTSDPDSTPSGEKSVDDEPPDEAFARKFLEMAEYGKEGRVFTYVIMLDGQWRFTETGEEFAIGLLSKHTMHADVSVEIAYSGEFFVRRLRRPHNAPHRPKAPNGHAGANGETKEGTSSVPDTKELAEEQDNDGKDDGEVGEEPTAGPQAGEDEDPASLPPSAYELVIDNDSGTYRPQKDLLPLLGRFLSRPSNLGALGRVRTMDGFDERLKRWKEERKEEKKRTRETWGEWLKPGGGAGAGGKGVVRQASVSSSESSSVSSSEDGDALDAVAEEAERERRKASGGGGESEGTSERDERKTAAEDAKRADENEDEDDAARDEKQGADVERKG